MRERRLLSEDLSYTLAQLAEIDVEPLEDLLSEAALEVDEGSEDVWDTPLRIALLAHEFLRGSEDLLGLLCESVLSHHVFPSGKRYEE
jgi:hypothetical protein